MNGLVVATLRFFVIVGFLGGLFAQVVVIPAMAADEAEKFPELAPVASPYAALAIAGVACVQAALLGLWMLLSMVEEDAIFTTRAFLWVDVVKWAAVVATALSAGVVGHLLTLELDEPAAFLVVDVAAAAFVGFAFALLVVVMRGVLRKATELKGELAEVI